MVHLFLLDVGSNAVDIGYLHTFTDQLLRVLDPATLPGGEKAMVGFIAVDSTLHFFQFPANDDNSGGGARHPKQMIVEVEGIGSESESWTEHFPACHGLIVSLEDYKQVGGVSSDICSIDQPT